MAESSETDPLTPRLKYVCWGLLAGLIVGHTLPYFLSEYLVPNRDHHFVLHVINYVQSPDLFAGDELSRIAFDSTVLPAPLYFYGLIYPFGYLFSAKTTILIIGVGVTLLTTFFAGRTWKNWTDLTVAALILVTLLHVFLNPIHGFRRSFTSLFLLGILWMNPLDNYPGVILLSALAAGIYPPVAVVLVVYYVIITFYEQPDLLDVIRKSGHKLAGLGLTVFLVLSPFLYHSTFTNNPSTLTSIPPLDYQLSTFDGLIKTVLVGSPSALFRDPVHFELVLILTVLLLVQRQLLGDRFALKSDYYLLVGTGLGLWFLAHLVHPLIYQPFKYTRMTLLLGGLLPFAENLHPTLRRIPGWPVDVTIRVAVWSAVGGTSAVVYTLLVMGAVNLTPAGLLVVPGPVTLKSLFVVPLLVAIANLFPHFIQFSPVRLLTGLLLFSLILLPHDYDQTKWRGLSAGDFAGLFETLQSTPPGTLIAGPPYFYMDLVPAFAKRPVYASHDLAVYGETCKRLDRFWDVYFSSSSFSIAHFLAEENIDYLLVDRRLLRYRNPAMMKRCNNTDKLSSIRSRNNPFLDRPFKTYKWKRGERLYLVSPDMILSAP